MAQAVFGPFPVTSSTASRTYRAMKRSGASGFAELNKEKKEDRRSTDPTIPPSNLSTRVGSVSRKGQRRGLAGAIACHVAASGMLFCRASWLRPTPAAGYHTKPSRGESSNGQIGQGDRGVVPRGWRRLPPDLSDKLCRKLGRYSGLSYPGGATFSHVQNMCLKVCDKLRLASGSRQGCSLEKVWSHGLRKAAGRPRFVQMWLAQGTATRFAPANWLHFPGPQ